MAGAARALGAPRRRRAYARPRSFRWRQPVSPTSGSLQKPLSATRCVAGSSKVPLHGHRVVKLCYAYSRHAPKVGWCRSRSRPRVRPNYSGQPSRRAGTTSGRPMAAWTEAGRRNPTVLLRMSGTPLRMCWAGCGLGRIKSTTRNPSRGRRGSTADYSGKSDLRRERCRSTPSS